VNVGSGDSTHVAVLFDLFPELNYLFFDPKPASIQDDRITAFHGDEGMFSMETVDKVLRIAAGRELIFLCDIRAVNDDENVWLNMVQQQSWGIAMRAKYMLLKFRLPYFTVENEGKDFVNYHVDANKPTKKLPKFPVKYLKGKVYFQIYATKTSSETRLMVERKADGTYDLDYYDMGRYEDAFGYFNNRYRCSKFVWKESELLKKHIAGYDDGYESVSEFAIVSMIRSDTEGIVKAVDYINTKINRITHTDPVKCIAATFYKWVVKSHRWGKDVVFDEKLREAIKKHIAHLRAINVPIHPRMVTMAETSRGTS
jgi:hypothetical protein